LLLFVYTIAAGTMVTGFLAALPGFSRAHFIYSSADHAAPSLTCIIRGSVYEVPYKKIRQIAREQERAALRGVGPGTAYLGEERDGPALSKGFEGALEKDAAVGGLALDGDVARALEHVLHDWVLE
jgi:hypothetical protein